MEVNLFYNFIVFIFGLIIGSFLNCVIYRLEEDRSFLQGRSFCPHCKHKLGFFDLIPILSFLVLKGKCRYCRKPISWQYPLVELATAVIFVVAFSILHSVFHILISAFLIVIFVYDLKHYLIPDKVIYPAIGTALIYDLLVFDLGTFGAALSAAAFFAAIVLVSQGKWMGMGDVKFAFLMGLILGLPQTLVALFFAFLSGAIIGIGLILSRKKSLKSEVPFGPFLVAGTLVALFWGEGIINWYLSFFQ